MKTPQSKLIDKRYKLLVIQKKDFSKLFSELVHDVFKDKIDTIEFSGTGYNLKMFNFQLFDIVFIFSSDFNEAEVNEILQNLKQFPIEIIEVKLENDRQLLCNLLPFLLYANSKTQSDLINLMEEVEFRLKIKASAYHKGLLSIQNTFLVVNKIAIHKPEGIEFISFSGIECVQAWEKYSFLFLKDGSKHITEKSIKELYSMLCDHHFIKTHKSHLVHLPSIKTIKKTNIIIMETGRQVPLARRRRSELIRLMTKKQLIL
jgi:hypothetical protein